MNSNDFNYQTPSINSNLCIFPNTEIQQDMESGDADSRPRKRSGRRKIKIEYIENKSRRHITFSKRKAGIIKKVSS